MTTELLIIRHGNTFDRGQTCLRVGAKTDLPLSKSGEEQAIVLGKYFKQEHIKPKVIFTGDLKRTWQTAEIALKEASIDDIPLKRLSMFNEIDYGLDEGKAEEEVITRIGKEALELWDKKAIVPAGWNVDTNGIRNNWKSFFKMIGEQYENELSMVFTSNGIARFALDMAANGEEFFGNNSTMNNLKLSTTGMGIFVNSGGDWFLKSWNLKPRDLVRDE